MKFILAALVLVATACDQGGAAAPPAETISVSQLQLTGRVVDAANVLDEAAERSLTDRLAEIEKGTSDQVVVVTLPSLGGEPIEKVALGLGKRWGVGRADVDNGVLVVIAPTERKVRIEVGIGLEGLLTDDRAAAVIHDMLPDLRAGRMPSAAGLAIDRIDRLLRSNTRRPQPKPVETRDAA